MCSLASGKQLDLMFTLVCDVRFFLYSFFLFKVNIDDTECYKYQMYGGWNRRTVNM